ncbi:MAG TPA: hypothetical protein VIE63_11375 [Ramlibacter sp.]|jgi:hypothetical protein
MEKRFVFACAIAAAALAGCAASAPDTTAMGAGPACDLRLDVGADHRCAVTHVTPPDPQSQLAWQVDQFGRQTAPRP